MLCVFTSGIMVNGYRLTVFRKVRFCWFETIAKWKFGEAIYSPHTQWVGIIQLYTLYTVIRLMAFFVFHFIFSFSRISQVKYYYYANTNNAPHILYFYNIPTVNCIIVVFTLSITIILILLYHWTHRLIVSM